MSDEGKTREQLMTELTLLRQRLAELERDQAGRKRIEEALRLTQFSLDTAADAVFWLGPDAAIVYANDAACRHLGYSREELLTMTVHAIDPGYSQQQWPAHWEELRQRKTLTFESTHRTRSGLAVPVEITASFVKFGDQAYNCSFARNITLRKQTEEALRESQRMLQTILDTIPVRVFWKDLALNFLGCNRCFALDAGLQSPAEITGKNDFEMGWAEQAELYRSDDRQVMETGRPKLGYDELQTTPEGAQIWLHTSKVPLLDGQGQIRGVLGTYEDITDRKRIEEELLTVHKLESVGLLAGGIAHDFNNLLTVIVGNVSLAKMATTPDDRVFKRLEEAEQACSRAKDLTQQLLTFARGGAPVKKMTSLQGILKDSCQLMLCGSSCRYELTIAQDLWLAVVDEAQISQVMGNLIMNAAQAMPTGGVIRVRAINVLLDSGCGLPLDPGKYVKISVQDEGMGIARGDLHKVFDPYFTTKPNCRGLGLATAYSIITRHGGYLTAESEPGSGATFHVYLPALKETASPAENPLQESSPGIKGRILVMDDEAVVREVTGDMLEYLGYEVEFAEEGLEAIDMYIRAKASGKPFDSVLMDLTIPGGVGGKEAAAKLLTLDPTAKLIVSSGYFTDPVMAEYNKYGFAAVITKPFRIEQLGKIVARVTGAAGSSAASTPNNG